MGRHTQGELYRKQECFGGCCHDQTPGSFPNMSVYDHAKEILCRTDPHAALRPQEASGWTGDYPLPAAVATYYAELGPDDLSIAGYGNGYFLPSLANLWAHQAGHRTHGHTGARLVEWDDDWLVVGDEGGDPFIFSRERGVVLRARHGGGAGGRRSFSATWPRPSRLWLSWERSSRRLESH